MIALYAAILSTALGGWTIFSWHWARGTRITVRLSSALLPMPAGTIRALSLVVLNQSDFLVTVRSAGYIPQDGSDSRVLIRVPFVGAIPFEVRPREEVSIVLNTLDQITQDGHIDLSKPTFAWVRLASGQEVRARKPFRMLGNA